jgi:phosphotransferase system IIA component
VEKLEVKLSFLNRKKFQEIDAVREAKNEIISKLRGKISTVFAQNHALRS